MSHVVIGLFDSDFDAKDAVDGLIEEGFDRNAVRVVSDVSINGLSQHHKKHEKGLAVFFKTIFGGANANADDHARLASVGVAVTVYADSEDAAARAADIMDDKGAINVDERAPEYNYTPNDTTVDKNDTIVDKNVIQEPSISNARTTSPDNSLQGNNENLSTGMAQGPSRSKSKIINRDGEASPEWKDDLDTE